MLSSIHEYNIKSLVKNLSDYINLGGKTVSVIITDTYFMEKRNITTPYLVELKKDHLCIYLDGQNKLHEFSITDEYSGWFYDLIYCMYVGMLYPIYSEVHSYIVDRLTKGLLKSLPDSFLDQFKFGDKNAG